MALQTKTVEGTTNHARWVWKMEIVENSINEDDLTSNVTVTSYLGRHPSYGSESFGGTAYVGITCGSETSDLTKTWNYGHTYLSGGQYYAIHSHTFTVKHNEDGTGSVYIESWLTTSDFVPNSAKAETTFTLTTIEVGTVRIAVNGEYKRGTPYVGVNGQWRKAKAYIGVSNQWKKGK